MKSAGNIGSTSFIGIPSKLILQMQFYAKLKKMLNSKYSCESYDEGRNSRA